MAQSDPEQGADAPFEEMSFEDVLAEARGPIEGSDGQPESAPSPVDETPAAGEPDPGQVDLGQATPEGTAPVEKGETPPAGDGSEVLSALPDGLRDKIVNNEPLTPDEQKALNDGYLRRADYSRKTADVSQVKKAADAWTSLWEDPEAAAVLHELQARRARGEAPPEAPDGQAPEASQDDFDPDTATRDEWLAHLDAREARLKAELQAQVEAPSQRQEKLGAVANRLDDIRQDKGMTEEAFAACIVQAREFSESVLGQKPEEWEIEKIEKLMEPFLPKGNGAVKTVPQPISQSPGGAPSGRSTAPSRPQRTWEAQGRQPKTATEEDEAVLDILEQRFGKKFSREDLDKAASGAI